MVQMFNCTRNIILYISGILILYFYLYAPPFQVIPFGVDKPILLFSWIYLTYKKQWGNLLYAFKAEWLFITTITFVSLFVALIHAQQYMLFLYDFLLMIECIPCSYALLLLFKERRILDADNAVLLCSLIASIVSCFLLMNPELTYYTKNVLLKYPEHLTDRFLYRGYGISDGLLFSYPVIQGFCFAFILMNVRKWKYFFSFIFLFLSFFSIVSNARSGFVPIFIAVVLLFIYRFLSFLKLLTVGFVVFFILSGIIVTLVEYNDVIETSLQWGLTSWDILLDAFSGERTENVDLLLGDMVVWPSGIDEWLVGTGKNLFNTSINNTDVGYFIRLNYGGIVYFLLWFFLCLYMFIRMREHNKGMALLLFCSLIYLNYKGDFFIVNPASRFFFLVYVWSILDKSLFKNELSTSL